MFLRGPGEERIEKKHSLKEADWNLRTLLALHIGLLDHAENVRLAALDALMEITKRLPKPVMLSPISLLARVLKNIKKENLSKTKAEILRCALDRVKRESW